MPRARNIKPGFFDNSKLGKLDSDIRVLFIGLWCLADREGILEFDIAEIRRFVFGYRNDVTEELVHSYLTVLSRLDNEGFISLRIYNGKEYLIITNFDEHQNPHHTESKGKLPPREILLKQDVIPVNSADTVNSPLEHRKIPADSGFLIPDSGFLNSNNAMSKKLPEEEKTPDRDLIKNLKKEFEEVFWPVFPQNGRTRGSMKQALAKYVKARAKSELNEIIKGVEGYAKYIRHTGQANQDAFRWLENERWRDDYPITQQSSGGQTFGKPGVPKSKHERILSAAGLDPELPTQPKDITPNSGSLF